MVKRYIVIQYFIFIGLIASGQTIVPDFGQMQKEHEAELKKGTVSYYQQQFSWYYKTFPDSAIAVIEPLAVITKKSNNLHISTILYAILGDLYKTNGQYSNSSKYYFTSLELAESLMLQKEIIQLYSALGETYRASGNYRKSLFYLHLAEKKAINNNNIDFLPQIQSRLASTYFELNYNDFTDPDYIFLKKLYQKWFPAESEFDIWKGFTIKYVNSSQQKAITQGDTSLQILNNNLLGSYHYLNKNFDSAIYFHSKALNLIHNFPSSKDESLVLSSLSHGYRKKNNLPEAKKFGLEALEQANKKEILVYKWLALSALHETYKEQGNYKKALEYIEVKDSIYQILFNNSSRQKIFELQEKFNFGKKEDEIEKLQQEKEQESKARYFLIIIFILISFTLLLFLFVVYLRFQNAKQKRIISEDEKTRQTILLEKSEAVNKARNDFFANISHEIRTPLNSILGYSEILQEQVSSPETKEYLAGIISSGRSLLALMNDLMDLSRIEAGKIALLIEQVNLPALCEEVRNIFQLKAAEKNLQLSINSRLTHDYFFLDEARLRQILLNLTGNSIKYTVEGTVSISIQNIQVDRDSDNLIIDVADTGIGIAPEQMEQLFTPFHQVSEAHSRIFGGSGLGLMICKRLVELMNGAIEVNSESGMGTSIRIILKKIKRYYPINVEINLSEPGHVYIEGQASIKLLLVEDNLSNRIVIKSFLKKYNIEITEAVNGKDAIDLLNNYTPDIIIMDIQMPIMDGFEATRIIKSNPKTNSIPVIVLTATVFSKDDNAGLFNEVIYKPISKKALLAAINEFIPFINLKEENEGSSSTEKQLFLSAETRAYLRNNLMTKWKQTTILLSNDDIEEFAGLVQDFSIQNNIHDLNKWSELIIVYSKSFNIKLLYETFNKFPNIVNSLLK